MEKVLIIIPAYNEGKSILEVINRLKKIKLMGYEIDSLIINDGSSDNTRELCQINKINHIDLPCNLGIGGAVQTGYKYAYKYNYDYAIQFDGDGQHDENYIIDILVQLEKYDFVIGSRFITDLSNFKSSLMRRFGINLLSNLIYICSGKKIYDVTSGFRGCNQKIIKLFAENYPSDYPEPDTNVTILKLGYEVKEIPVKMNERKHGASSISGFKSVYYMIKVSMAIIISSINIERKSHHVN